MFKSYNFWIRLVAVLVLLLRIVGAEFGFNVDSALIIDLATAIASVLVVLGVIQVPVQKVDAGAMKENGNQNVNGGDFMKTFEKIKEDLMVIKEKIATLLFGEELVKGEISAIIDGIINENDETGEVNQENFSGEVETIIVPAPEGEVVVETGGEVIIENTQPIEIQPEEVVVVEESADAEAVVVEESADAEVSAVEEVMGEEDKAKEVLNEFTEKLVDDAIDAVDEFITIEEKSGVDMEKLNSLLREKIANLLATEIDNILRDASV